MTIFIITSIFILQLASLILWMVKIRPYLKENGLGTLRGVNYAATILNDVQQSMEAAKKKGVWPTFLTVFFVFQGTSIVIIVLAVIRQNIK